MIAQSVLVFGASMFLNISGFVFYSVATRRLGVVDYGVLYALLSGVLIAALPFGIATPVIARFAAEFRALHDDSHLRGLTLSVARGSALLGAGYIAASFAFAIPLSRFLHVPAWTVPCAGVVVTAAMLAAMFRAIAQGVQDFLGYCVSFVAEGATKIVAIAALTAIGWRVLGGLTAYAAGSLGGLVVMAARLYGRYAPAPALPVHYDWRRIVLAGGGSSALTIALILMGAGDVLIVKHVFDSTQAGIYSAASITGKILFYLVSFISTVLLPQAADRHARGAATRGVLLAGGGMLVACSLLGLLIFKFFGLTVLHALVGTKFDAASDLLVWYAAAMASLALTSLLGSYGIATHRLAFAVPLLGGTFVTLGIIAAVHPDLLAVVRVLFVGNLCTALAVAVTLVIQGLRPAQSAAA
jgi:O-antigen/teichoic acid export membrane protein